MKLQQYLKQEFNNFNLIKDSFGEYEFSIHLELEPDLYQIKDDSDDLNEVYFDSVYKNAINIYEDLFHSNDDTYLVSLIRSSQPHVRKTGIYEKYVKEQKLTKIEFKKICLKDDQEQIIQYSLLCRKKNLSYKNLIKAICNRDFRRLKPRLRDKNNYYPEIIFVNKDKNIILSIYDDRGAFILLNNSEEYERMKKKYKELLMDDNN